MSQSSVTITRRGAERVRGGHLWVYRSDVRDMGSVRGGAVVRVTDERGRFVAHALYSDRSEIALRVLTAKDETVEREWWRARLRASAARRAGFEREADAFRLVYSEGDLLPSLIVDRYSDVLVLQTLSQGTESLKETLVELLVEEFAPRAVVERNDVRVRALEGLPARAGVLYGDAPEELEVVQHGVRFRVAPLGGQKTGAFLDQRENHLAARAYARGRALDCFTFNGGFALSIAPACESVEGLDISAEAVAAARRNAELNGAANVSFREANVFDALHELESAGERFQTIILDPPAFAKNRASVAAAARGYKEINLRALKLLSAGGVLVTCTCSYHMTETLFLELISEAAADARRRVQIVERRTQSRDHPVLLGVPETLYLKCVVARVVE
ncbi:MAG: class I SAM-dependent rRNA methyltransferase [Acidobacteriota bacterium]|nr:class I SAM-dependent rRNA methyltransferase [Acidobacteriota bacterium]MDQ5836230.1 class I SAM-dependent rRNA methyltransferase [Acidobacteriota bacterium]